VAIARSTIPDGAGRPPRRRRTPAAARDEILQAAAVLLAERPSEEVTVLAIMERTTLSRKSFYVYFRDRTDVISSLVAPLRSEAETAFARLHDATDILDVGLDAILGSARTYREHGAVLRALAAASARDDEAAQVWRGFIEPVVAIATKIIVDATATGASAGLDPEPTAQALVGMNVQCFLALRPDTPDAEVEALATTLRNIWARAIFLDHPR
jgi:AcrR family transcriptional regulator